MGDVVKKKVQIKPRNPFAVLAKLRSGAGQHTDQKQRANIEACNRLEWDDHVQDYWQDKEEPECED